MKPVRPKKDTGPAPLGLPGDMIQDAPILTVTGINSLSVENLKGIVEYNQNVIQIKSKVGLIEIIGKNLYIDSFCGDEMWVSGRVTEIIYHT